tara:strand:- start:1367 stop:1609 length:243 start_codon:yes stop_codon:yes gene_type:complete
MNNHNKLIWQLSGRDALKIAEHHLIHLTEYMKSNDIVVIDKGIELISEFSATSFVIIDKSFVEKVRVDLKPNKVFLLNSI